MRAIDHATVMLRWWSDAGIHRADLAVRRRCGAMIWHRDLPLDDLPLSWVRAENVRRADVYIRPARGQAWPLVLIDDVSIALARRVSRRYSSLVVQTSVTGGCHVWLRCARLLTEPQRLEAQRWLARRLDGDRASVSGEHLGRLAGFKNWKRHGCWVNLVDATYARSWIPQRCGTVPESRPPIRHDSPPNEGPDCSDSGKEWGWVCGLLESGNDPDDVCRRLVAKAHRRQRRDPERYAKRTCRRAQLHVSRRNRNPQLSG